MYIYVCKHKTTYIILLIKRLQKTTKKVFKHTCFYVLRLSVLQTTKHTNFKHKRTEYKKKEKGQLSNTIKKSRADRSSRQKHRPPYSTLLTSTRNIPKSNIQRSDKDRQGDCR